MKNKHWLIVILIVSLLTIAFFCGENHRESAMRIENGIKTQTVNSPNSHQATGTQKNEEYNRQTNVKTEKSDENVSGSGTKKETAVLPDKSADIEKSATETDKKSKESVVKIQADEPTQNVQDDAVAKSTERKQKAATSNPEGKKDEYLTDPVPDGKPKPVEWQLAVINKEKKLTCTLSVTCKTILDNMDKFNKDKLEVLPKDGIIYKTQKVTFYQGESVFDVLLREMKNNKIHMEFEMTPIYNSNYIEGIHNLYEFDCGELSGWMYKVNGWFPNYGCSRYTLKDGDVVEWIYTCDLGRDIDGGTAVGGKGE